MFIPIVDGIPPCMPREKMRILKKRRFAKTKLRFPSKKEGTQKRCEKIRYFFSWAAVYTPRWN